MGDGVKQSLKWPKPGGFEIAASVGVNLLALALPIVMLQVFDRIIPNEAHQTLFALVAGLTVALALDFALKAARVSLLTRQGERFERDLTVDASFRLLSADLRDADPASGSGDYERLNAIAQLRDHVGGEGRLHLIDLPFAVLFIGMIWLIGGPLVIAPFACLAILVVFSLVVRRAQSRIFDERYVIDDRRYAFLSEFLEKIGTIKANRMETGMLRRFELLQESSRQVSRRLIATSGVAQAFSAVFSQAAVAGVGLCGAYFVLRGDIGVAELAACTLLNGRAVQPMLKILTLWVQAEGVAAARRKVEDVLATPERSRPATPPETLIPNKAGHVVEFRNLSLRGEPTAPPLFASLTRTIPSGSVLHLSGDQGGGKSTLARAILGEHPIEDGAIAISGRDPRERLNERGPGGLTYLGVEPAIFDCTLIENIALSHDHARMEAAFAAVEALGLDEEVRRLPLGYETPLGANGAGSMGFLQRIALARALALAPRLLIVNDALSAMDPRSSAISCEVLRNMKGGCTMLTTGREIGLSGVADDVLDLDAFRLGGGAPLSLSLSQMVKPGRAKREIGAPT